MRPQATPTFDDQEIAEDEVLYRHCKNYVQVSLNRDTGEYVLSDQVFTELHGGCSVEIESLIQRGSDTARSRYDHHNAFAIVSVTVGEVRSLEYGDKGAKGTKGLNVAYTPIDNGAPGGPNPYHADIFPLPRGSAQKALKRKMRNVIPIDQARAAIEYAKKQQGRH
jgi:hypothetical protein